MKVKASKATALLQGLGGKVFVLCLVTALIFGSLFSLPVSAQGTVTENDILLLMPNVKLYTDSSGYADVGKTYAGGIDGSYTDTGTPMTNVQFVIKSDATILLRQSSVTGQSGFSTQVVDDHTLIITVDDIGSDGISGARSFGAFDFIIPNRTTPADQIGSVWIESVSCDGVTVPQDRWDAASGYTNVTLTSAFALAQNSWNYRAMSISNATFAYYRTLGELTGGTHELAAATPPTVTLGTIYGNGSLPSSKHVDTGSLEFQAYLQATGDLGLDPALVTAGGLSTSSWTQVYSGGASTNAAFYKYFAISGVTGFDVYAMLDTDYATNNKIYLKFVNVDASVKDIFNVQPTIKMNNFYFANGITDTYLAGNVVFGYVAGAGKASYKAYDGASVIDQSYTLTDSSSTVSAKVELHRAVDPSVAATNFLTSLSKEQQAWNYSLTAQGDNLGASGELYRNFVSAKTISYAGGDVAMDRIWFKWNTASTTLAAGIGYVVIDDFAGTHYDSSEMSPIGFEAPQAGANTTAEVWAVLTGTPVKMWDSASGLTTTGQQYFEASAANANVLLLQSGMSIGGLRVVYSTTSGSRIAITGDTKVLFEAKDQGAAVATTAEFYNNSKVTVYDYDGMSAANELASATKADTVLYKANFTDTIEGNKSYVNSSKGGGDMTTAGDTLQYSVTVNGPTDTSGSGVVRSMWVMDEHNGTLDITHPLNATVIITRANSSSTVAPTTASGAPTVSGNTYTYTGVTAYTTGYGIDNANQMVFTFTGNFVEGDVIVIKYYATIKDNVQPGNDAVENEARAMIFQYSPPSGGTWVPDWSTAQDVGGVGVGVNPQAAFGDIVLLPTTGPATTYSDAASKSRTAYYTDDDVNLYVLGGQFGSDRDITSPAYLVELPANLVLTGPLDSLTGTRYTVGYSSSSRTLSGAAALTSDKVTVIYYNANGVVITPATADEYKDVRFTRVVFDTTLSPNQMIAFNIPVVATETLAATGTSRTARAAFLGCDDLSEPVYRNSLGGWNGGKGDALGANGWSAALKNGQTLASFDYIQSKATVRAHLLRNKVGITQAGSTGPLYLGDTANYTTTITNTYVESGMAREYGYDLEDVVLLLPIGMELEGDTVNVGGTPVTVAKSKVQITRYNRDFSVWRIVIPANKTIASRGSLAITYTLRVTSLELLVDGNTVTYSASDTIYASIYYDPNVTGKQNNHNVTEANSTTGVWWDWDTAGHTTGKDRMQESLTLRIQEQRIHPGVIMDSGAYNGTVFTSANSFDNIASPQVDWRVSVYNGYSAQFPMKDFTVAVVLPLGIRYNNGMLQGPEPTGVYENNDGQQVLYWVFDEALLQQATTAANIEDGGLKANTSLTLYFRTIGDASAVGPRSGYTFLMPDQNYFFEQQNVLYGTKVAGATELNEMNIWLTDTNGVHTPAGGVQHAVRATKQINMLLRVDATIEKSVTANGKVSSSSAQTPVYIGRGEEVDFSYTLKNHGTGNSFTDVILYDALPMPGDKNTLIDKPRNSSFALEMVWSDPDSAFAVYLGTTLVSPTEYEVYYSATAASTKSGWETLNTWVPAASWDANDVTPAAFKIVFSDNVQVAAGTTLSINWKMKMEDDPHASLLGGYAYNSAAISFSQKLGTSTYPYCVEPSKCGVLYMGDANLSMKVTKMWYNPNAVSRETFRFRIEKYDPTLGWQLVALDQADVTGGTVDGLGHITIAIQSGEMLTAEITNLFEGQYRVTEVNVPDGLRVITYRTELYLNRASSGADFIIYNIYEDPTTPPGPGGGGGGEEEEEPEIPPTPGFTGPYDPGTIFEDDPIPLAGPKWSLINLICMLLGAVEAVVLGVEYIVRYVKKKRKGDNAEAAAYNLKNGQSDKEENIVLKVLAVAVSLLTGILFFILEGIKGQMTLFTKWSFIIIPVFVIGLVLTIFEHRMREEREED